MKFAEFQAFRSRVLAERPALFDAAQHNVYAALAPLAPPAAEAAPSSKVHRCHVASNWGDLFGADVGAGLGDDIAKRALISCGVRDSLARLFAHYAASGAVLHVPCDNYPVYHELAHAAGLATCSFATLPTIEWPTVSVGTSLEILLITNPLKPRNRWLNADDVAHVSTWLAADSRRRLLLDTVYTFDIRFDAATLQLFATGQTIVLHSLTKAWLQPRLFGITLIPPADAATLTPLFVANPPSQINLVRARDLLLHHAAMPAAVRQTLRDAQQRLRTVLQNHHAIPAEVWLPTDAVGYLFPVQLPWQMLLEQHRVLAMPASVFGSACDDISIVSSLSLQRT